MRLVHAVNAVLSICLCLFVFDSGSLSAMRFVAAVQEREKGGDKQVEQLSRELWKRIWSEDKDITEPASLSEVPDSIWVIVFKEIIHRCVGFVENCCCCYAGSVESRVAWRWDQGTAEASHLVRDQGQAEEEHTRSSWLRGEYFLVLIICTHLKLCFPFLFLILILEWLHRQAGGICFHHCLL